jgi:hypothetical protein
MLSSDPARIDMPVNEALTLTIDEPALQLRDTRSRTSAEPPEADKAAAEREEGS